MSIEQPTPAPSHPVAATLWRYLGILLISSIVVVAFVALIAILKPGSRTDEAYAQAPAAAFDLRTTTVDSREILSGGPPKDGIPALTNPDFVVAGQVDYLHPHDRVIGVTINKEARAYPLAILNHHEIVNDTIGATSLAVTYCPLCDSAAVFDRRTPLGQREFGVSGLLYNSNVLMYDRMGNPDSLWSQIKSSGISGPGANKSLTALPCELTTWDSWKSRFPKTLILSTKTGHQRDYRRNPYEMYFTNQQLMFPAKPASQRFPNKERVLGVWVGNWYRAYPESQFPHGQDQITDTLDGKQLTIVLDRKSHSLRAMHADEGVSWLYSFWFAWYALHPETSVYGDAADTGR